MNPTCPYTHATRTKPAPIIVQAPPIRAFPTFKQSKSYMVWKLYWIYLYGVEMLTKKLWYSLLKWFRLRFHVLCIYIFFCLYWLLVSHWASIDRSQLVGVTKLQENMPSSDYFHSESHWIGTYKTFAYVPRSPRKICAKIWPWVCIHVVHILLCPNLILECLNYAAFCS